MRQSDLKLYSSFYTEHQFASNTLLLLLLYVFVLDANADAWLRKIETNICYEIDFPCTKPFKD